MHNRAIKGSKHDASYVVAAYTTSAALQAADDQLGLGSTCREAHHAGGVDDPARSCTAGAKELIGGKLAGGAALGGIAQAGVDGGERALWGRGKGWWLSLSHGHALRPARQASLAARAKAAAGSSGSQGAQVAFVCGGLQAVQRLTTPAALTS